MSASDIPEINLSGYTIDESALRAVPAIIAEKHKIMPLFIIGKTLTLAMADPSNIVAMDEARSVSGMDVSVVRSSAREIEQAIAEYYGIAGIVEEVVREYSASGAQTAPKRAVEDQSPIVKLVNVLISQALSQKASDIHVEPESDDVRIRYRIDGLLHEETSMPPYMNNPIISRIKILAGMDIAESRVPQDGRFELVVDGAHVDIRVSTFPTAFGEKAVLRLLDKSAMIYTLKDIGMAPEMLDKFSKAIHKSHGIVLVTGPTGSGKTTTLYSTLAELNSKELNITTVEDPIEYEMKGVTQSQVNVKAGLTFASALRSILRQDPDVILIGEIRDLETASIAIQSALTGHMVFSTLHTNDAAGALTRLLDMGVEPFLISSSVEAVLAQRLVRLICSKCKTQTEVPADIRQKYPALTVAYKGTGCKACKNTGYKGRKGIFELLIIDDAVRKMISDKKDSAEIKKYAVSKGMRTLFDDGIDKVSSGQTTLDEVLRVTELEQI